MTFNDWKAALIPLGWVEVTTRLIASREGPEGFMLSIMNMATGMQLMPCLPMPPDIDTMRALMTGLQIPCTEQKERDTTNGNE